MCKNLTICCNNLDAVMFDLNGVLVVAFNYSVLFVLFFLFFAISENIIHAYCIRLHPSFKRCNLICTGVSHTPLIVANYK